MKRKRIEQSNSPCLLHIRLSCSAIVRIVAAVVVGGDVVMHRNVLLRYLSDITNWKMPLIFGVECTLDRCIAKSTIVHSLICYTWVYSVRIWCVKYPADDVQIQIFDLTMMSNVKRLWTLLTHQIQFLWHDTKYFDKSTCNRQMLNPNKNQRSSLELWMNEEKSHYFNHE